MNARFRDQQGRIVPVHALLRSLHSDLLRELTALAAVCLFVTAVCLLASGFVHP